MPLELAAVGDSSTACAGSPGFLWSSFLWGPPFLLQQLSLISPEAQYKDSCSFCGSPCPLGYSWVGGLSGTVEKLLNWYIAYDCHLEKSGN